MVVLHGVVEEPVWEGSSVVLVLVVLFYLFSGGNLFEKIFKNLFDYGISNMLIINITFASNLN